MEQVKIDIVKAGQAIQEVIKNWDAAYIDKDVDRYLRNIVRDDSYETCRQKWVNVMHIAEYQHSASVIKAISITHNEVTTVIDVHEEFMLIIPDSNFGRWLFRYLPRIVFKSDNARQLTWIESSGVWLCQSGKTLSSKVRIRLKH